MVGGGLFGDGLRFAGRFPSAWAASSGSACLRMMFSFSGDTHRGWLDLRRQRVWIEFLVVRHVGGCGVVTGMNAQSSNKDTPWILKELEEGIELRMGEAGSHCSCLEYVMACLLALATRLRPKPARCVDSRVVLEIAIKVENCPRFSVE
jgi:hypothetical protein